ncbi:type III restriction enzyme-like protein, variant 2 [Coprinopsis cinerea AmutBmut pab1-1]|nr:type III restriction enzyme-like protein, variant 2 [Coprinopsis cinerea AmutBmut pab1-1]
MDIPWTKLAMRHNMTLGNIGPYCASLYLFSEMRHILSGLHYKVMKILATEEQNDAMAIKIDVSSAHPTKLPPLALYDLLEIIDGFEPYFVSSEETSELPIPVPLDWCTPKLRIMVNIIRSHLANPIQMIIFVEQRQTAACLAQVLEVIPELKGLAKCGYLMGHGTAGDITRRDEERKSKADPIKLFREKEINILIATSVAEEGLDFPACELVIRFDPPKHLVGYVQSRGRARSKVSKYIVMIQQEDTDQLERYQALQRGELELSKTYHNRTMPERDESDTMYDDDTHPMDLAERERFVVPSTGAVLTYDNALSLINHLCALIPRDSFTEAYKPQFIGDFQSRMRLPASLPLQPRDLVYLGYPKRSKQEAKRSVAFQAVKRLLKLNVFDDYLLPVSSERPGDFDDSAYLHRGNKLPPDVMEVHVKDPWYMGPKLWLHPIVLDSETTAGLVTGTSLPPTDILVDQMDCKLLPGTLLAFDPEDEREQRRLMQDFTHLGVWARNTAKPIIHDLSFFLVPLTSTHQPDFAWMQHIVDGQKGSHDWSNITEKDYGQTWVFNTNQIGRIYQLQCIRNDLALDSRPPQGSLEGGYDTYRRYFATKWARKKREAFLPKGGPLIEATVLARVDSGEYDHEGGNTTIKKAKTDGRTYILPRDCCRVLHFPTSLSNTFRVLPALCRKITDIYRARVARIALRLPFIEDKILIESLTIPAALLAFSNQRLETLGDAVLQLCTTVHLFNQYPNRHEGQLTTLRRATVSNKFLLQRALEMGLEEYITVEIASVARWRYILGEDADTAPPRSVRTLVPRRSLQDCMEALLGASFLQGGIPMALQAGPSLGVEFGGPLPWEMRYERKGPAEVATTHLFDTLQERLGYTFHSNSILVEAVTHPSFATDGPSYQRLEFLGDAILDLVVVHYLYEKFPEANSHQLSLLRAKVICAPTLAYLAIKELGVHKILLINNMGLYRAIEAYVPVFEDITDEEIARSYYKFDPPKAISDVFESLVGAVLVDSGYNYDKTSAVVLDIMSKVLDQLSLDMAKDPVSLLLEWVAQHGCREISFSKNRKFNYDAGVVLEVHGKQVVGPIVASSPGVAKFIASERALSILTDESNELALSKLCDCEENRQNMEIDVDAALAEMKVVTPEPVAPPEVSGSEDGEIESDEEEDMRRINDMLAGRIQAGDGSTPDMVDEDTDIASSDDEMD